MTPLDDELRNLLKRKEPPAGFANRVMVVLDERPARVTLGQRLSGFFRRPELRWVVVAAVVCVIAVASIIRHKRQQRVRQRAEQAIMALQIARSELNTALQQAQYMTVQAISAPRETRARKE